MSLWFIIMVKIMASFQKKESISVIPGRHETVARVIFLMAKKVFVFCQQILWLQYFNHRLSLFPHSTATSWMRAWGQRQDTEPVSGKF